ncbi:uncharacterized protein [Penaeus vannamei]|uniref:uncharacterized protein n=1 Tax=Penaeus vannamei TaxID=6689 RepID=UPI00387F53D2
MEKENRFTVKLYESLLRFLPPMGGGTTTMTEGLATPLRSVLTCGGCCQRFDDGSRRPKFLSCFHTACLICLRKGFSDGKMHRQTNTREREAWKSMKVTICKRIRGEGRWRAGVDRRADVWMSSPKEVDWARACG